MSTHRFLSFLAVAAASSGVSASAEAQFEISPRLGAHFDRGTRPEWVRAYNTTHLLSDDAWEANAKATVPLLGVRLDLAMHPRVRLETELLYSRNSHSDFLVFNSEITPPSHSPDSVVSVAHVFASVRIGVSLTSPNSPLHLRLSAGPVLVRRSSSATVLINRTTEVGGSVGLSLVKPLGQHVGIGADALFDLYGNSYKNRPYPTGQGKRFTHHDLMILAGLTFSAGNKTGYGWDSGPQLAPRHNP